MIEDLELGHRRQPDAVVDETLAADEADGQNVQGASSEFDVESRPCFGRYQLLEKLGQGGMGAVYKAQDPDDGSLVAIKVLSGNHLERPVAVQRFLKEARLLAEVNNRFVTNLLEVGEEKGIPYLAMEYVAGRDLKKLLTERGHLEERLALAIMADVARALVDAHERGIIHRDIKPENILLVDEPAFADTSSLLAAGAPLQVKLSDFGLARHLDQSESLDVTQAGAILGTPYYMSPEQCSGGEGIGPESDVYSMGATLFHLLSGRPPFMADDPLKTAAMHRYDVPPVLKKLKESLSDRVVEIVEKSLAKHPAGRYADAGRMLDEIERLLRGEPSSILTHPVLPQHEAGELLTAVYTWDLAASPAELWPHVANTERVNSAIGLPPVEYTTVAEEGRVRRFGNFRLAGMNIDWEEHPYEWVEGRRMGVLREFTKGPFKWFMSTVELTPKAGGGTELRHSIRIEPRGILGRAMAAIQINLKAKKSLDRVYRRIDAVVTGTLESDILPDPFEEAAVLPIARRRRLDRLLGVLVGRGADRATVKALGDHLASAPAQDLARIRPLELARHIRVDPDLLVAACLLGACEGLLVMFWDILCPGCRISSGIVKTLRDVREHGHCEACDLDFKLDFARSIELVFRPHPEIRGVETGTYCIGGPQHSPHVVAQMRLQPGERLNLELALPAGEYILRGPQLPYTCRILVRGSQATARDQIVLSPVAEYDIKHILKAGNQLLAITNGCDRELLARIERTIPRDDVLTAARAAATALFRELFPGEITEPGQLMEVATVTLWVIELANAAALYREVGDAETHARLQELFAILDELARDFGGALIKTLGEGGLCVFDEASAAVRAALRSTSVLAERQLGGLLQLKMGIQRGPAMVTTLNDRLDYFGATVNHARHHAQHALPGEVVLSTDLALDPLVRIAFRNEGLELEPLGAAPAEGDAFDAYRVKLTN